MNKEVLLGLGHALPASEPTREEHQQNSVGVGKLRVLDLPAQNNELPVQESILYYQFLLTATEIQDSTGGKGLAGRLAPKPTDEATSEGGDNEEQEKLK